MSSKNNKTRKTPIVTQKKYLLSLIKILKMN